MLHTKKPRIPCEAFLVFWETTLQSFFAGGGLAFGSDEPGLDSAAFGSGVFSFFAVDDDGLLPFFL